jgi:hypothetical protein
MGGGSGGILALRLPTPIGGGSVVHPGQKLLVTRLVAERRMRGYESNKLEAELGVIGGGQARAAVIFGH